ncbi:unnamed protein product, partial [Discosporangium mesarthrocarpum]
MPCGVSRRASLAALIILVHGAIAFVPSRAPLLSRCLPRVVRTSSMRPLTSPMKRVSMVSSPQTSYMDVLAAGIKAVAVGKSGSKPIPEELVQQLITAMDEATGPTGTLLAQERLASFLGSLFVKHSISPTDEEVLRAVANRQPELKDMGFVRAGCSAGQILAMAGGPKAQGETQELALKLLAKENLDEDEAYRLGKRIFDLTEHSPILSLCAHILRVRYETPDEWVGLVKAQEETLDANMFNPEDVKQAYTRGLENGREPRVLVQLAEPFDGMTRAELLTPLLAYHLQKQFNVVTVCQCGPSAGPKYGQNLRDLAIIMKSMKTPFVKISGAKQDIADDIEAGKEGIDPPEFGWYMDQQDCSPALAAWVDLRRNIIKRPFMATSEKFINPCGASVLIASAFHPSYSEKMMDIAEKAT